MSQPNSSSEQLLRGAASKLPASLKALDGEFENSATYAEVCATRQIELRDQRLRSFVVRHSVVRLHCVLVFVIVLLAVALIRTVRAEVFAGALMLASMFIAASTKSINGAISSDSTSAR